MANTYTSLYVHLIFAVKERSSFIHASWEESLHKYIIGILKREGQKGIVAGGTHDHIHLIVGIRPNISVSDLVRTIKSASSRWVNEEKSSSRFRWQEGYGAFSIGQKQLPAVVKYVKNQKQHHRKKSFKEENANFLKKYEVEFKNEYLFEFYE